MAGIFNDSKTFVDMKMHASPEETLAKFEAFMASHDQKPSKDDLKKWVEMNFAKPGSEFESWIPNDWHENPKFLNNIKNEDFRRFASNLHGLWLELGRKMTKDVAENTNLYSIIPVPNPVIVPGGRFREFYYWDSYWIIRGLLLSEMYSVSIRTINLLTILFKYVYPDRLLRECWKITCPLLNALVLFQMVAVSIIRLVPNHPC